MTKIYKDKKGYPRFADSGKPVHIWAAEQKVGGKIGKGRVVHHRDEDKGNFRPDNLQVMNRDDHSRLHAKKRRVQWF